MPTLDPKLAQQLANALPRGLEFDLKHLMGTLESD